MPNLGKIAALAALQFFLAFGWQTCLSLGSQVVALFTLEALIVKSGMIGSMEGHMIPARPQLAHQVVCMASLDSGDVGSTPSSNLPQLASLPSILLGIQRPRSRRGLRAWAAARQARAWHRSFLESLLAKDISWRLGSLAWARFVWALFPSLTRL